MPPGLPPSQKSPPLSSGGSGHPGGTGSGFWTGRLADPESTGTGVGVISPGWDGAGPMGPGSVLHAELDKVGDSTDPRLFSLAHCCSGESISACRVGTTNSRGGHSNGDSAHVEYQASEYLAKYCLTIGSCGAIVGWLERGKMIQHAIQ